MCATAEPAQESVQDMSTVSTTDPALVAVPEEANVVGAVSESRAYTRPLWTLVWVTAQVNPEPAASVI